MIKEKKLKWIINHNLLNNLIQKIKILKFLKKFSLKEKIELEVVKSDFPYNLEIDQFTLDFILS